MPDAVAPTQLSRGALVQECRLDGRRWNPEDEVGLKRFATLGQKAGVAVARGDEDHLVWSARLEADAPKDP